jgi:hypothetical protein
MTSEQSAAYVIAQAVCLVVRALGMQADNQRCVHDGMPPMHLGCDFEDVTRQTGIGHNDVITLFNQTNIS